jgi:hypothetical protein
VTENPTAEDAAEARSLVTGPRVHDIGPHGLVTVAAEADDIHIRGVDGSEARVVAPADAAGLETLAEPGRFSVWSSGRGGRTGFVELRIGSRGFGFPLGTGSVGTIEIEVPVDARVEVQATSGDVALRNVGGGVNVRTAAGTVSLEGVAGPVSVDVASGDVDVAALGPLALTARSVSGDIRAVAPRFEHVAIETVSGAAALAGAFAPGPVHAVSTVSGHVDLAVAGGLTLETTTISGDVACSHPDRRSGDGRTRPLVIGDGVARFAVRSMSGGVEVRAAREPAAADEPAGSRPAAREPAADAAAAATADGPAARDAAPPPPPPADPAALAVLEALARGEIDVGEAERRLAGAAARGPGSEGAPGA